jgi:hypothetical protein
MTKNLERSPGKKAMPRGRSGGRNPLPENQKKEQICVYLPVGDVIALKILIPLAKERNNLIKGWVRAYIINHGESDRLLAQSPLAAELLAYLEATDAPEQLRDRLESLIVQRASDEDRLATGVIKTKDGAYIV